MADNSTPKTDGLYEVNVIDHMNAKVDAFYQNMDSLSIAPSTPVTPALVAYVAPATLYCEICIVNGHTDKYYQLILIGGSNQENANFMNNNQRNNLYFNTYYSGWHDRPNFSYRNNNPQQAMGPPGFQKATQPEPKKFNLELLMEIFVLT